jgi:hypothetical protein
MNDKEAPLRVNTVVFAFLTSGVPHPAQLYVSSFVWEGRIRATDSFSFMVLKF